MLQHVARIKNKRQKEACVCDRGRPKKEKMEGQKRAKTTSDAHTLAAGGFACTFVIRDDDGVSQVVRITEDGQVAANNHTIHLKLMQSLPGAVPNLIGGLQVMQASALPKLYRDAIERGRSEQCRARLRDWDITVLGSTRKLAFYRMEFADKPNMFFTDDEVDFSFYIFRLIIVLYAAQAKLAFEHGDLTAFNTVTSSNGRPQLIDFDYATLAHHNNPNRKMGNPLIMPYEFSATNINQLDRQVLGAVDMWALGILVLSWYLTPGQYVNDLSALPISQIDFNDLKDRLMITHYATCALHAMLFKREFVLYNDCRTVYRSHRDAGLVAKIRAAVEAYMRDTFQAAILKLSEGTAYELLLQLLALDPRERVFNGDVFKYLYMDYFSGIERARFINTELLPLLGLGTMPNTFGRLNTQIGNIYRAGLPLICAECGNHDAFYLDADRKVLLCQRKSCHL
jgi:hypothetical protein